MNPANVYSRISCSIPQINKTWIINAANGRIVLSGPRVHVDGTIDASSENGKVGRLLIDPDYLTIVDRHLLDGDSGSTVGEWWLEAHSLFADITLEALFDIDFALTSDHVLMLLGGHDFTLLAGRDINLNGNSIVNLFGGGITLMADKDFWYQSDECKSISSLSA